jgi:hypothetical protein
MCKHALINKAHRFKTAGNYLGRRRPASFRNSQQKASFRSGALFAFCHGRAKGYQLAVAHHRERHDRADPEGQAWRRGALPGDTRPKSSVNGEALQNRYCTLNWKRLILPLSPLSSTR